MKNFTCILLFSLVICSCKKDKAIEDNSTSISNINGKAQKGPYKNGSPLVVYELNNLLGQTGKSFSSIISDDAGNFSLNNISLSGNKVLITANGYYYMEHFDIVSPNQLYLEAVSEVSSNSTINVNLLTHIIKPRIEDLVSKGSSFSAAQTQAQNELKNVMGVTSGNMSNFETIDITNDGFLFAMSLLFQRRTAGYWVGYNYTSELSALLSNFRNDFKSNGLIDNNSIIDTLIYNANRIQLIDAKDNLQAYYSSLGISITPPNFEQYIYLFQKKYSTPLYTSIVFADSAVFSPEMPGPPSTSKFKNILDRTSTNYSGGGRIFSAIVPCDSTLSIRFTPYNNTSFNVFPPYYGWKMTSGAGGTFTITNQRKNFPNALFGNLQGSGPSDSAKVEYFQNNSSTPYFSKIIYF